MEDGYAGEMQKTLGLFDLFFDILVFVSFFIDQMFDNSPSGP